MYRKNQFYDANQDLTQKQYEKSSPTIHFFSRENPISNPSTPIYSTIDTNKKNGEKGCLMGFALSVIARRQIKLGWQKFRENFNLKRNTQRNSIRRMAQRQSSIINSDPYLRCSKIKLFTQIWEKLQRKSWKDDFIVTDEIKPFTHLLETPLELKIPVKSSELQLQEQQNYHLYSPKPSKALFKDHSSSPTLKVKFNFLNRQEKNIFPQKQADFIDEQTITTKRRKRMRIISSLPSKTKKISIQSIHKAK